MKKSIIIFTMLAFLFSCTNKTNVDNLNNDLDEESQKLQSKPNLVDDDRIEFSKTTDLEKLISKLNLNDTEKEALTFLTNSLKEKLMDENIGINFKKTGGDESKIEETIHQFLSDLKENEIKEMLAKIKENKDKKEQNPNNAQELDTYKSILASGFDGMFEKIDSKNTFENLKIVE
ncbi:membrane protein (plasmid) [Borreliella chilensis]|uniref:Membrane protein n=1 Tax=Borreliella chilensis TaxID=1245910 RepID=A0A0A7V3B0_9SPIR|nr:membrane protein [Borreliella chilensis]